MAGNNYKVYTDIELVALINDSDPLAFREIYQRYFPILHIHAFKRIADTDAIKDILQDVFTSIWRNRAELKLTHTLSAYLYTATRYKITNYLLQEKNKDRHLDNLQVYLDKHEPIETDFLVRQKELTLIIEEEINSLPPAMRRVFIMSRFESMPHKEIASNLQISEQTVRTHIKKALRILRGKLPIFAYLLLCARPNSGHSDLLPQSKPHTIYIGHF